ncbi:MAG: hypothetical protein COW16_08475 [Sphingomonadales bacterium CG12_big_fil_rev_8_21_14_0_65_65_10]|nr:MAG: hypothetical protein COW16_08475 [Sphingomonadales bacterium CG12_big_fil_rev_8_21_14_0_65_65_10]
MADFGDRVRIKASDETLELELAGREGEVYGWTTPSITGVTVIGSEEDDVALNVNIEGLEHDLWFHPDLVELIDHNPGMTVSINGMDGEVVRLPNGEWQERSRSK